MSFQSCRTEARISGSVLGCAHKSLLELNLVAGRTLPETAGVCKFLKTRYPNKRMKTIDITRFTMRNLSDGLLSSFMYEIPIAFEIIDAKDMKKRSKSIQVSIVHYTYKNLPS